MFRPAVALVLLAVLRPVSAASGNLDAWWAERDAPGAREALDSVSESVEIPGDFGTDWRLARAHCWLARILDSKQEREAEALVCRELAERAREQNPERVEGWYWSMVAVGLLAQERGVAAAFFSGLGSAFEKRLSKALSLDRTYDACGPLLARGSYLMRAPWPVHDTKAAARAFEEARRRCPGNQRSRLYLADLALQRGRDAQARAELEQVLRAGLGPDPAEGKLVRREARERLQELEAER